MVPVSATFYKQLYLLPTLQLPCIFAVLILMELQSDFSKTTDGFHADGCWWVWHCEAGDNIWEAVEPVASVTALGIGEALERRAS